MGGNGKAGLVPRWGTSAAFPPVGSETWWPQNCGKTDAEADGAELLGVGVLGIDGELALTRSAIVQADACHG